MTSPVHRAVVGRNSIELVGRDSGELVGRDSGEPCRRMTMPGSTESRSTKFMGAEPFHQARGASHEPAAPGGARLLPSLPDQDLDQARQEPRPTRFMAGEQVRKEQGTLHEAPRRVPRGLAKTGLLALLLVTAGCRITPPEAAPLERFEYTEPQMGVPFRIVLYAPNRVEADAAGRAAFDRIATLNAILSDYEYDSELSRLSRTAGSGEAVPVGPELWAVLARAQAVAQRSDGAFDVTVGPLVSLWRKARRDGELPDPKRLQAALAATGWQHLELDPKRRAAWLKTPRMRLDLGGIAKGFAVDEALRVLRERGLPRALISGGGDLAVGEPPPGKPGWRIEVASLDDVAGAPEPCHVLLRNEGLATSGDMFQFVEIGGVRYSHIVNPRTGLGLSDHSLITVIARDGMTADSLSTALSVLGLGRADALVRKDRAGFRMLRQQDGRVAWSDNPVFRRHLDRQ